MNNTALIIDLAEARRADTVREYQDVKATLSAAKKREAELKKDIIAWMTDGILYAGDYVVTLKETPTRTLDTVTLRKELPELWDEYGKTTVRKSIVIA